MKTEATLCAIDLAPPDIGDQSHIRSTSEDYLCKTKCDVLFGTFNV
ncbi:hypothetical protein RR42_s1938 [Cupriavidus basilensis]|uniref:Uncharacterized protein n=1 Tax=Cupriavidus basilensis TaxID=68895 RepID=A0A0C4YSC6_9BURK|nr:hypothetical protein RR42_s1938 [Cupriavidus basilensis]